ncbi:MAG: insulinase family protein, partial [Proteobacteria bacterium]|nr:insulinase family protein [Pseudomonadota bacterium]
MRVVVVENHRVPVVTHMVWYGVGSADEGPGESGIAHFLEHLMFKGTKKRQPGEFSKILARNGGRENAFTSADYTAYFQTIAVDRLELVMEMEADRMTNLRLTEQGVATEKAVVLEERRSRTDNNPGAILREQVNAALFLNYPYRRPVIGWAHEIEARSLKSVMAFYKKWYAPGNAILVVAGDITAAKLKPLAEKYYGRIPAQKPTARVRPAEPPQGASRRLVYKDARVRLASIQSLGKLGDARAAPTLSGIMQTGRNRRERLKATNALAEVPVSKATLDDLAKTATRGDPVVGLAAARVLAVNKDRRAIPALLKLRRVKQDDKRGIDDEDSMLLASMSRSVLKAASKEEKRRNGESWDRWWKRV